MSNGTPTEDQQNYLEYGTKPVDQSGLGMGDAITLTVAGMGILFLAGGVALLYAVEASVPVAARSLLSGVVCSGSVAAWLLLSAITSCYHVRRRR